MEQSDKKNIVWFVVVVVSRFLVYRHWFNLGASFFLSPFFFLVSSPPPAFISLPNGTTMGCRVIFGCLGFSLPNRF